jgi:hypothetical protein
LNCLLVQVHGNSALVAALGAPENLVAALGAYVAPFFVADPFSRPVFLPVRDGPQNDFFPNGHGKLVDVVTGKILAFMAAAESLFPSAGPDGATPAKQADPIGQAAVALEVVRGNTFETRNFFLVHGQKPFQELFVVVPGGIINTAYTAVEPAVGQEFIFDFHGNTPFSDQHYLHANRHIMRNI